MHDSNPFATRFTRPGAMEFLLPPGSTAELLIETLAANQWRGQIIGPHGSGKSTLLHTLRPLLEARGRSIVWLAQAMDERRLAVTEEEALAWNDATQVIVDGYEQLGRFARWWLARATRRANAGLLVTAHTDIGLPTLWKTQPSEDLAREVVAHLITPAESVITADDVSRCYQSQAGNVRETLFALYDLYEQRRS
jgi:energy-coupling factor transporter ATP-binding protein EcfA2